jgi:hypothetical protein
VTSSRKSRLASENQKLLPWQHGCIAYFGFAEICMDVSRGNAYDFGIAETGRLNVVFNRLSTETPK